MPRYQSARVPGHHDECEDCGRCVGCNPRNDMGACDCPRDVEETVSFRETNKDNLPPTRRVCGNCGRLGHLARTCSLPKKAHVKIGVEVEGWWRDLRAAKEAASNWHMTGDHDGSLAECDDGESYEFRTRPGSLWEAISQVLAVYPDYTHRSAGMHVHVSFATAMDISCFASPEFLEYYKARWKAWGTAKQIDKGAAFWYRLNGGNTDYCADNRLDRMTSYHLRNGSRYQQLNFTSFARHGTIECRMLPLFRDARLAIAALEELISIYENFLEVHATEYLARFDREAALDLSTLPETITRHAEYEIDTPEAIITDEVDIAPQARVMSRELSMAGTARSERETVIDIVDAGEVRPGYQRRFMGQFNSSERRLIAQVLGGV